MRTYDRPRNPRSRAWLGALACALILPAYVVPAHAQTTGLTVEELARLQDELQEMQNSLSFVEAEVRKLQGIVGGLTLMLSAFFATR